jgi:hypothetical protein
MALPPLPPGFVLDQTGASGPPPLPPGFVLDNPTQSQANAEAAAMPLQNPSRFAARAPHRQLQAPDLSVDAMRQALEPEPNTRYATILPLGTRTDQSGEPTGAPFLTLPDLIRGPLLGALDIGQGRYLTNDTGTVMRPTENTLLALGMAAGISPAYRSGRAIAETSAHGAPLASLYARNRPAPPPVAPAGGVAPVVAAETQAPVVGAAERFPVATQPPPGAPPAGPQSVGAAATPGSAATMTAREAQAARTTAEATDIFAPPMAGDATEYVPGVGLTRAELELTPTVSREAKALRTLKPERFAELDRARAEAYATYYDDMATSETLVLRAKEARDRQASDLLDAAFKQKTQADAAPVAARIEEMLKGPEGKRGVVSTELRSVLDRLTDSKGKLETDVEQLYGVRKHINDRLSREAGATEPQVKLASSRLLEIRREIDAAIEQAAPGFRDYLQFYAEASRPIDAAEELLAAKARVFKGADRHVAFADFDRVMKDWASDRAADGANAAKSFTDEQWRKLMDMWRSLQRTAEAERLARAQGSDTAQNAVDLGRMAVKATGLAGAATMNPLIALVSAVGGKAVSEYKTNKALNRMMDVSTRPPPAAP